VLAYYKSLKTSPDEALVFFYGGHGAIDPRRGHYLQLQNGRRSEGLVRSELRQAMQGQKGGVVVLLTDCCSVFPRRDGTALIERDAVQPARELAPVLRALFFQSRGLVDVTASAPGTPSWGDRKYGGLFTYTLCGLLGGRPEAVGADREGRLTWKSFFPVLRTATDGQFRRWLREGDRPGAGLGARNQLPHAFALDTSPPN